MEKVLAYPRRALSVAVSPQEAWNAVDAVGLRGALLWQVAIGGACAAVLMARASQLVGLNRMFARSELATLIGIVIGGQMVAYLVYLLLAAAITRAIARLAHQRVGYGEALRLVAYSSFPLLIGWAARAVASWVGTPDGIATIRAMRPFVETVWGQLTFQADVTVLATGAPALVSALLATLSLFLIWHGVTLWGGLRRHLGCSRASAVVILIALFALVLVAQMASGFVGAHWHQAVVWTD